MVAAGVAAAALVAVPTPAFAMQTVIFCSQEGTYQITRKTDEGYATTVVGYCAAYTTLYVGDAGSGDGGKEHGGGGGGSGGGSVPQIPPKDDCKTLTTQLNQAEGLIDTYSGEYAAAQAEYDRLVGENKEFQDGLAALWQAKVNTQAIAWYTVTRYLQANGSSPFATSSSGGSATGGPYGPSDPMHPYGPVGLQPTVVFETGMAKGALANPWGYEVMVTNNAAIQAEQAYDRAQEMLGVSEAGLSDQLDEIARTQAQLQALLSEIATIQAEMTEHECKP